MPRYLGHFELRLNELFSERPTAGEDAMWATYPTHDRHDAPEIPNSFFAGMYLFCGPFQGAGGTYADLALIVRHSDLLRRAISAARAADDGVMRESHSAIEPDFRENIGFYQRASDLFEALTEVGGTSGDLMLLANQPDVLDWLITETRAADRPQPQLTIIWGTPESDASAYVLDIAA